MLGIQWAPEQASTMAVQVDVLFAVLLGMSLFMVLFLTALVVFFAVKYRRTAQRERASAMPERGVEFFWMGGLLLLFLVVFAWAARLYVAEAQAPAGALEIHAIGKQWMWQFQHPTGQREINELHVPLGIPVKMILATQDVIHSFYVPAFRTKQDLVPGRYTSIWFTATRTGRFHLFCAEYCGLDHARMGGEVVVMEPAGYENWLSGGGKELPPAAQGEKLFAKYGCIGCHGAGNRGIAPALAGVFGSKVALQGGASVTADETYLRDSILSPTKQVVAGYDPIMPSFAGRVGEADLLNLIAYIKSLSAKEKSP